MQPVKLGRYRIVRSIGRGGMGDVSLARYEALPGVMRLAAIKVLRPELVSASSPSDVFEEARVNAHVTHPNVVALLEAGIDQGVPWLSLEYVPGPTLRAIFEAERRGPPISPWLYASIVSRACAGLAAVHEAKGEAGQPLSIVHRDISPENLLVSWDGVVKVLDFGIARSALAAARTATGTIKGKLGYMAPEQARQEPVDKRTDIFSLGVVLWEALARRSLFASDNAAEIYELVLACKVPPLSEIAPDVPPALAAIAHRALSTDPSGRFWTATEMKQALDGAMMAANVAIGEPEIAVSLAMLLPGRVREHEVWLLEAARGGELANATTLIAPMIASMRDEPSPKTARLMPAPLSPLALTFVKAPSAPPLAPAPPQPRAPRASRLPHVVFLACAAVVALVGVAGVVFLVAKKLHGLDSSFVSTIPSAVTPDGRALAADEPPSPPGTPASSQGALPAWPKRTINGDIGEYAPQLEDGLQAFMAAVPLGDTPIERGLVVCRIQTFGKADLMSGDDLHVRAVLGPTPLVANDGPEDANLGFVSAPLVSMKPGDAVHVEVYDRDVFAIAPIETVQATWHGGALAKRSSKATMECRQLAGALLQRLVSIRAARADASTSKLATADLDGRRSDWGFPDAELKTARADVGDVAGLVGWDDARVRRRVTAADAALARVDAKKSAVFDSLHGPAKATATVAHVTVTAGEMSCADHGAACTIRVTMRNDGDKPLMRTGWADVTAYAANRESGPERVSFELRSMSSGNLDPGGVLETTATPPRELSLGGGPSILGVCRENQCAALRIRP